MAAGATSGVSPALARAARSAKIYRVRGRVQGVGFRDYTQRVAARLGLTGYVRNLDDGRVEVYAAGPPQMLSDLAAALHQGPYLSVVHGVEEQDAALKSYSDFQIRI